MSQDDDSARLEYTVGPRLQVSMTQLHFKSACDIRKVHCNLGIRLEALIIFS